MIMWRNIEGDILPLWPSGCIQLCSILGEAVLWWLERETRIFFYIRYWLPICCKIPPVNPSVILPCTVIDIYIWLNTVIYLNLLLFRAMLIFVGLCNIESYKLVRRPRRRRQGAGTGTHIKGKCNAVTYYAIGFAAFYFRLLEHN